MEAASSSCNSIHLRPDLAFDEAQYQVQMGASSLPHRTTGRMRHLHRLLTYSAANHLERNVCFSRLSMWNELARVFSLTPLPNIRMTRHLVRMPSSNLPNPLVDTEPLEWQLMRNPNLACLFANSSELVVETQSRPPLPSVLQEPWVIYCPKHPLRNEAGPTV